MCQIFEINWIILTHIIIEFHMNYSSRSVNFAAQITLINEWILIWILICCLVQRSCRFVHYTTVIFQWHWPRWPRQPTTRPRVPAVTFFFFKLTGEIHDTKHNKCFIINHRFFQSIYTQIPSKLTNHPKFNLINWIKSGAKLALYRLSLRLNLNSVKISVIFLIFFYLDLTFYHLTWTSWDKFL